MASNSGGSEDAEQIQEVTDVKLFKDYVLKLISLVLEDENAPPTNLIKKFSEPANMDLMKKFVGESQARSFMIEKITTKGL